MHQNIAVLYDMWLGSANAVSCNNLWELEKDKYMDMAMNPDLWITLKLRLN